jgi:hypothetical protein
LLIISLFSLVTSFFSVFSSFSSFIIHFFLHFSSFYMTFSPPSIVFSSCFSISYAPVLVLLFRFILYSCNGTRTTVATGQLTSSMLRDMQAACYSDVMCGVS